MTTKQVVFLGILGLSSLLSNAQNVQSDALATSGGLQAGTMMSGSDNTFYGYQAGKDANLYNKAGNTFVGSRSGNFVNGQANSSYGALSGEAIVGNGNSSFGYGAGANTRGDYNILLGLSSGEELQGSNNILIGNNIGGLGLNANNKLMIDNTSEFSPPLIWGDFANDQLKFNGKVGIGYGFGNYPTTAGSINVSNYNMFVKGGILTEEVRVSLTGTWADYVFKKDYKLPTLQEVEKQIQEKGHLFNVPSAKQVKEDGIELGEMAKIQQEKIEELTLYLIQQNKEIELLKQKNKELEDLKILVKSLIAKK